MSDLLGHIPGPYGKPIAVYGDKDHPDDFRHDLAGTMDLAGIHDPKQRAACEKALQAGIRQNSAVTFQVFLDHGGRTVPKQPIARPTKPATLQLPADPKIRDVCENWVTLALEQPDWAARAAALLDVLQLSMKEARSWTQTAFMGDFVHAFAMSILITSAIEHLAETEINCLEQAALYALSCHPEWQEAGADWLRPFRRTWFRDWASARPAWQDFASGMRQFDHDLPSWIVKGASR